MAEGCVFCQIIRGDAPAEILYRDAHSLSFLDISPSSPGHALVVPLAHHNDVFSLSVPELEAVARHSQFLARHILAACGARGMGIHQLNGALAGQTVFHYHAHLIPAYPGVRRNLHGRQRATPTALAAMASAIRQQIIAGGAS